jgi:hypothetical protein
MDYVHGLVKSEYTPIPIVRTPEINPGEEIKIDIYLSGTGIPEQNRLFISPNKNLVGDEDPGEVRTYIQQATNDITGETEAVSGENHVQIWPVARSGAHIGLRDANFYPVPDMEETEGFLHPRVSERDHDNHAPVEVQINSRRCNPGEYSIPVVFIYESEGDIKLARQEASVYVRTWAERHRRALEAIGLIGVLATLGILYTAIL